MSDYSDQQLQRALRVLRLAEGESRQLLTEFLLVNDAIRAILFGLGSGEFTLAGKNAAIAEITNLIKSTYATTATNAASIAAVVMEKEAEFMVASFLEFASGPIISVPKQELLELTRDIFYQGKTMSAWFKGEGAENTRKIRGIIEDSFLRGKTVAETTGIVSDVIGKSSHNIKTLVRSSLISTAQAARERVANLNDDILEYKIWESILDVRTTANICGIRDQKKYTLDNRPIDHNLLWKGGPGFIHWNCRSTTLFKIKGVGITTERTAIGAGDNYVSGANLTRNGKVRKPTRRNVEKGLYEIEKVGSRTRYEGWLRRQPTDFIADVLGSKKAAKAFKGGEKLQSVTNFPQGTPLTIDQF